MVDARVPVRLLNLAWHRLEWPPVEIFAGPVDIAHSMHPLLMPARSAARLVTIYDLFFLQDAAGTAPEIRRDYPALAAGHARRADAVIVISQYTAGQVIGASGRAGGADRPLPAWRAGLDAAATADERRRADPVCRQPRTPKERARPAPRLCHAPEPCARRAEAGAGRSAARIAGRRFRR